MKSVSKITLLPEELRLVIHSLVVYATSSNANAGHPTEWVDATFAKAAARTLADVLQRELTLFERSGQ